MAKAVINFCLSTTGSTEVKFQTEGIVRKQDNVIILDFIEQTDLKLHTKVSATTNKVIVERKGSLEMKLVCDLVKDDIVYMKVDKAYEIKMINHTDLLLVDEESILVIYQTEMDKENNITHQLKLSWEYI